LWEERVSDIVERLRIKPKSYETTAVFVALCRESADEIERLRAEARAAAKFVMWALMEGSFQGCDIDGGAAQDKAVELGLLKQTLYNPAKHGPSDCCSLGDIWFVPSEALLSILSPAQRTDVENTR
jgi:hypothetical protein